MLSVIGLLMIGYAVFAFNKSVPFPSFYTLIPTAGTGLIILFASSKTTIVRLLGLKPFVGIGLISYSAYLWHVPLFAFARYRNPVSPDLSIFLALSLLSMLLAYLSWRYFEKPFRNKTLFSRKTIFICAGIGSLFFITVGLAGHFYSGWPGRMDKALQVSIEDARLQNMGRELCLETGSRYGANEASCTLVNGTNKIAYLMGDSHAIAMTGAMKNAFEQKNIGLIRATERGCPPVQGVYVYESEADKLRCFKHNQEVFRYLGKTPDIEYVILAARWALYIEGKRFDNEEGGVEHLETLYMDVKVDEKAGFRSVPNRQEGFQQAYTNSVEQLLSIGKKVVLVYPVPEAGWNVPRYITGSYLSNASEAFSLKTGSTSHRLFQSRNANVYEALDKVGAHPNLFRVFPEKLFCNNSLEHRCIVQENEKILYGDDDHLSSAGARLITEEIMKHLD